MVFVLASIIHYSLCIMGLYIAHYITINWRYYRNAISFPSIHPTIPSFIVAYILAPFYKFDVYQMMGKFHGTSKDLYCGWFPKFTVVVKNTKYLSSIFSLPEKSFHYEGISYMLGPAGLISAKGKIFRRSKMLFMRDFNGSSQEITLENLHLGSIKLLEMFQEKASHGWVKLGPIIRFTTTSIVMANSMDIDLPDDNEISKLVDEFEILAAAAILKTTIGRIPLVSTVTPFQTKLKEGRKRIENCCRKIYVQKKSDYLDIIGTNSELPNQFVYNIIRDREGEPVENVYADFATLITAGLHTSAMTTAAVLIMLGMHPQVQEEVFQEDKKIQSDMESEKMTEGDLSRYDYLHRVIKETLRLYPIIPLIARHVSEDLPLGRYTVPKGSSIAVYLPYIHRDPLNYPNPTLFDPDRFLPENIQKLQKYAFMPFSHGHRQCPANSMDIDLPDDNEISKLVDEFEMLAAAAFLKTTIGRIPLVSTVTPFQTKLKEGRKRIENCCRKIYVQKKSDYLDIIGKNSELPNQFVYNLIRDREGEPVENVYADFATLITAGLHTSAMTTAAVLIMLGMHPQVQEKVFQEDKKIQSDMESEKMTERDISRYDYLHRVIKETLRLYPIIPLIARHVSEDLPLGRYTVPKGSSVAVYLPYIHRDPLNYPNPTLFDPDRFLPENIQKLQKYAFMPFSHGHRQCPGIRYATQSVIYLVSAVVRNFKVVSQYKSVEEMDKHMSGFIALNDLNGFPARLELRQK